MTYQFKRICCVVCFGKYENFRFFKKLKNYRQKRIVVIIE